MPSIRSALFSLQRTPLHPVLSMVGSVALTVRRRALNVTYRDRDGDWVCRQPGATFYGREYSAPLLAEITSELQDLWCFAFPIQSGDIIVDVGAGVGDDALVLSGMVGPSGRVIAIEAHPATYRCLVKTVKANRLTNVTPIQAAVSDTNGVLQIEDSDAHVANRVLDAGAIEVRALTLDCLLEEVGAERPNLVKMNIEGAEAAALRGAPVTLRRRVKWVISCHDFMAHLPGYEASATRAEVVNSLAAAGYAISPAREDSRAWVPGYVYATPAE